MAEVSAHSHTVDLTRDRLELAWAAVTDTGRRREVNQDAVLAEFPLFVVADGMGGHIGGEIASASAVERLHAVADTGSVSTKAIEKALARAVKDIAARPEATGEATVQVTTDHSVVQELIASGRLSPEEAENHPYGNVITRALGPSESVTPDYVRLDVVDGDRFVICSDGLTKELTDFGIQHFLAEHPEPDAAVEAMLDAALENGGRDNISIVVVNVSRVPGA